MGLPVSTNDSRYFCIVAATVALTEELPPIPLAPPPDGPPTVEFPEIELADTVTMVATAAGVEVVAVESNELEVSSE